VTLVHATWDGPGTVTWNVTADPCAPPRPPLHPELIAPDQPYEIPEAGSLWACPTEKAGQALEIQLEGYKP
jgi:hypothetical protein